MAPSTPLAQPLTVAPDPHPYAPGRQIAVQAASTARAQQRRHHPALQAAVGGAAGIRSRQFPTGRRRARADGSSVGAAAARDAAPTIHRRRVRVALAVGPRPLRRHARRRALAAAAAAAPDGGGAAAAAVGLRQRDAAAAPPQPRRARPAGRRDARPARLRLVRPAPVLHHRRARRQPPGLRQARRAGAAVRAAAAAPQVVGRARARRAVPARVWQLDAAPAAPQPGCAARGAPVALDAGARAAQFCAQFLARSSPTRLPRSRRARSTTSTSTSCSRSSRPRAATSASAKGSRPPARCARGVPTTCCRRRRAARRSGRSFLEASVDCV